MSKKLKLITHADLDGVGCAIVVKQAFEQLGYEIDVIPASYASLERTIRGLYHNKDKADKYLMTDISPETKDLVDLWLSLPGSEIIDHHASRECWKDVPGVTIITHHEGNPVSATKLCELRYINYSEPQPPYLNAVLDMINKWDAWLWPNEPKLMQDQILQLQGLCSALGIVSTLKVLPEFIQNGEFSNDMINIILESEEYKLNRAVKKSIETIDVREVWYNSQMYRAGVVMLDEYQSIVAEKVFAHFSRVDEDLDALFMVGSHTVSARTKNPELDLSVLTKAFGGGGHKSAAGFPNPKEFKDAIFKTISNTLENV